MDRATLATTGGALYTHRLRGLVAVLPPEMTAEILAASEKMTGVVTGFSQN